LPVRGTTANLDIAGALDNRTVQVACVVDPATGYHAIYTNGVLERAVTNSLPPLTSVSAAWSFLGRSLFSADAWLNATVDEFRIYDGRLTPQEIAANFASGPDALALPVRLIASNSVAGVILSWPAYAAGFSLEQNVALDGQNVWSSVPGTPALDGNAYYVTLPVDAASRYFRLRR
jgi:hypothetical protein